MEESQKRKERLQAMRMEAAHNTPDKEDKDFQAASGILSNPLNDSSPSSSAEPHTPRFDYYTDPLSAFSASKRKGTINRSPNGRGNSLNRFRISPMNHQPSSVNNSSPNHPASQQPIWQPNFHSSNNQSPVTNAQQPIWQPIFHSDNNQTPTTPFGSPVRGYINAHVSCGPQYYSSPGGFSNSSNGSPMSVSPVPRFNQTPNQDNFWQQQQQQQLPPQPPQQQSGSQPRQYGRGSPWSDPQRSPGGRGSPWSDSRGSSSPSPSPAGRGIPWSDSRGSSSPSPGGRGFSWSDSRGSSGGRGSPWTNPRGRGGRGLGSSPSPNQGRGGYQGRGSRGHVSARERPDLFVKKSMVADPWKNLMPLLIDSLRTFGSVNTATSNNEGNRASADSPVPWEPRSINLKKPKPSEIRDNFQSGPSLAESLALSLADAVSEGACN
eukprot:Gb_08134 [translate_table: standard]